MVGAVIKEIIFCVRRDKSVVWSKPLYYDGKTEVSFDKEDLAQAGSCPGTMPWINLGIHGVRYPVDSSQINYRRHLEINPEIEYD